MDKRKPVLVNPSPSDVEASDSSDEELESDDEPSQQIFVRSDRNVPGTAAAQETSDEEEEEESESESESQGKAAQRKPGEADDSSSSEWESESESDTSSHSQDASPKSILAQNQKAMVNGGPKKAAVSSPLHQQSLKQGQKDEPSSKKAKVKTLKRDREGDSEKNDYFRKRNKGSTENASTGEKSRSQQAIYKGVSRIKNAGNEKQLSAQHLDRKTADEKAVQAVSHDKKNSSKHRTEENRNSPMKISGRSNRLENGSEKHGYKAENVFKDLESDDMKEKPKKSPQNWTSKDEVALSSGILNCVKLGSGIPSKKTDGFWGQLSEQLEGKLEAEWTKEQLCEKLRRMRKRYHTIAAKMKDSQQPYKHRKPSDELLFSLWKQIWDKGDAHKLEDIEEVDGVTEELLKSAKKSPTKERKLAQDTKEPDAANGQNFGKKQSGVKGSQREESGASEKNGTTTTPMELDRKGTPATVAKALRDSNSKPFSDVAVMPGAVGPNVQDDYRLSRFASEIHKLLQDGMRTSLSEMHDASKTMLEEWLSRVKTVFESAIKAIAGKSRLVNGMGVAGIGGTPFRSWELMDFHLPHGEQAFPQQWYELHLQELDIYSQRLQLMQRECHLKQEQLKLQLEKGI